MKESLSETVEWTFYSKSWKEKKKKTIESYVIVSGDVIQSASNTL